MTDDDRAVYVISVAAKLAGAHPQTLRAYERKGLLSPARTEGGRRRYSAADIDRLGRIGELTGAGLNLQGVLRVLELEEQLERLRRKLGGGGHNADGGARAQEGTAAREPLLPLSHGRRSLAGQPSTTRRTVPVATPDRAEPDRFEETL